MEQLPQSGNKVPRSRNSRRSRRWMGFAPFLAVPAIGGALVAILGDATAVALSTTCVGLAALYGALMRMRLSRDDNTSQPDDDAGNDDERSR